MSFLKNTISLMALFSVIPAAFAVTARPGVMPNSKTIGYNTVTGTARRIPTVSQFVTSATTNVTTNTGSSLLTDKDCIDSYTSCIKSADACGAAFEECTTDILFHAKMPSCISVLGQCSAAGINSLFGTSNTSALKSGTTNSYGEITDYTYPTAASVLGQMISAAAIENMYDTSSCIRRYTTCLKKENVCGQDFELCTSNPEFKKQAVLCDSTLARCASDGKEELFGNGGATSSTLPATDSRIGEMISEGAALAAVNAVSTCYKITDQCIMNACTANPYKCHESSSEALTALIDAINNGTSITDAVDEYGDDIVNGADVHSHIKNSCEATIGSNKYCYATFIGDGELPTNAQLRDEDNQAEIFEEAFATRMNSGMRAKISDLVKDFDTRAKEKCVETIKTCAMRTCGGGSGAACYALVYGNGTSGSINGDATYDAIQNGCSAIVNTDMYCKYAAQNQENYGLYEYSFVKSDAFTTLFPKKTDNSGDPIGVVATLNASLSTSYNDAAIAQMKKRCQNLATSCVKNVCGTDYQNCYRNRLDIYSTLTNSGNAEFDNSMNHVGGVLDYTIILGMCANTVKNADACAEHIKITQAKQLAAENQTHNVWGADAARNEWLDAGSINITVTGKHKVTDKNGNELCYDDCNSRGLCDTATNLADCGMHDEPITIDYDTYAIEQATDSLFKELIYDLEIEAQATYNAKLTKQQNECLAMNKGGVLGAQDTGSAYMWAKLKSGKVPEDYTITGLDGAQLVPSKELYGSFCRVRVTLQSDDKAIQDYLKDKEWNKRYFAIGDPIICGSWIPTEDLEELAAKAGNKAKETRKERFGDMKVWGTVLGALGFGGAGAVIGDQIEKGNLLNSMTGLKSYDENAKKLCKQNAEQAIANLNTSSETAARYASAAKENAKNAGVDSATIAAVNIKTECDNDDAKDVDAPTDAVYLAGKVAEVWNACRGLQTSNLGSSTDWRDDSECGKEVAEAVRNKNGSCADMKNALNGIKGKYHLSSIDVGACDATSAKSDLPTLIKIEGASGCAKSKIDADQKDELEALKAACDGATGKKKFTGAAIGGTVGVLGGGGLTYLAIDSYQKQQLTAAYREAYDEFMQSAGSKIQCFVGSDSYGTYGQVIPTSME